MLKDRDVLIARTSDTIELKDLFDTTENLIQAGTEEQIEVAKSALLSAQGAYFNLALGEKAISKTISLGGTVFFNTNQPVTSETTSSSGSCESSLGIAKQYQINFTDLSSNTAGESMLRFDAVAGGGYPPDPAAIIYQDIDGIHQVVCVGTDCSEEGDSLPNVGKKTFWTEIHNFD